MKKVAYYWSYVLYSRQHIMYKKPGPETHTTLIHIPLP